MRVADVVRSTAETSVSLQLDLDASGSDIKTGLSFFDHMLEQLAKHCGLGLKIAATSDLRVDSHHLVEDVGLAFGDALRNALGDRNGIARFGEAHQVMDETLVRVVVDLSGRPYCVFQADLPNLVMGDGFQVEMVREFFVAVAMRGGLNLHAVVIYGQNTHHQVEALFKGLARALRQALCLVGNGIPSTKGTLTP